MERLEQISRKKKKDASRDAKGDIWLRWYGWEDLAAFPAGNRREISLRSGFFLKSKRL